MAQAVGGVVGAVVGFAVGGPAGAQWGWAIGAAVGNSFTTIKQPRLGDLAEIRAGEGGPRARVYGLFRPIGGQIVWSGQGREIRTPRRQGKGGPKVESSTLLRSYAIGICEGPITGVSRIWRNNELVYDVRPGSTMLADSAKWIEGKTILLGGWDQLPHPTIEAEMGAANAPAMRGTAMLVVTDEDLTDLRGAIPAYQFEVGNTSTERDGAFQVPSSDGGDQIFSWNTFLSIFTAFPPAGPTTIPASAKTLVLRCLFSAAAPARPRYSVRVGGVEVFKTPPIDSLDPVFFVIPVAGPVGVQVFASTDDIGEAALAGRIAWFSEAPPELFPDEYAQWIIGDPSSLAGIISRICSDATLPAEKVDVASLPGTIVAGFATSPDYSAVEAIKELAKVYFFDAQDADGKVRFIPRGGDFVRVIDEAEFVEGEDEPETDTTRDSISVPRLLHLMYFDVDGGQAADKQFSERQISPRSEAPTVLSTPVVMDAETAARAIRIQHQVMEEELRGELVFGLSDKHLDLASSDVIALSYRGRSQRIRFIEDRTNDGWQGYKAVRDRQSAYTATVQATPPATVTNPPSRIVGPTRFAFLDIPALTQSGDVLSYHVAVCGELPTWRGAAIERQDGGSQWSLLATDGTGTVMGALTTALPLASEFYPDESNAITVALARADDELEAISREAWLSRGNACALVRADGTAEIVQFRDAVETTPGTWRLTGLQRGRLNSGASAHPIGAAFVLLDGALLLSSGSERIGTTLTHRAYSVGETPTTATTQVRTWSARSQREWPPIIETAVRTVDTLAVTWTPRHRFGSEEAPVPSSHFDGWRIEATSGSTTVGVDSLTPSASLNVAGLTNPITVTVRGRNRLAGLGDPATRIVP
jgi:hypothetical protein